MDEWSAWQSFFTTGYVLDYLKYKGIHNAQNQNFTSQNKEKNNEIPNRGSDNQGAEYR